MRTGEADVAGTAAEEAAAVEVGVAAGVEVLGEAEGLPSTWKGDELFRDSHAFGLACQMLPLRVSSRQRNTRNNIRNKRRI